jgi:hypothetical protein
MTVPQVEANWRMELLSAAPIGPIW